MDAVLIPSEVLDEHLYKKRDKMLCKLDMEKAYNHVNLGFVDYMLVRMDFGSRWRQWIKPCITISFTAMVNGGLLESFRASRGIRQGDPLSLLLSIIVVKALNKLLVRAREVV